MKQTFKLFGAKGKIKEKKGKLGKENVGLISERETENRIGIM